MSRPVLLLATTPTDISDKLVATASQVARPLGADIEVLVVSASFEAVEPTTALAKDPVEADKVRLDAMGAMSAQLAKLADAANDVRVEVTFGEPAEGIVGRAELLKPAYIVMGTHGRSGVRRAILGSVAEGVLRVAPCPVIVVPPRALEE